MKKIKTQMSQKQSLFVSLINKFDDLKTKKALVFSIALLTLVALLLLRSIFTKNRMETLRKKTIPDVIAKMVGAGTKVTINPLKNTNGIYEFELLIGEGDKAQKYTSYITKDGKILFTSGIKLSDLEKKTNQAEAKKLTCEDLNKVETAKLTAFVVADCPYGLQMQRVFKVALNEQPALASNLEVRYIGSIENNKITSMHGDKEAQENLKQICIREEQKNLYWPYVSCYMQEGKSEDCSITAGLDTIGLQTCMTDETKGIAYAQKDFDLASKYQIGSSPTLLLNDKQIVSEFDFGGRVANSLKQIVCCGSKTQGDYCKTDLSKNEVAVSLSLTDEAAQVAGSDTANCN